MICERCNTPLQFDKKENNYFCPEDRKPRKDPFNNNQMLCLPFTEFVLQYPEVTTKKRFKVFEQIGYDCVQCGMLGTHIVWWKQYKGVKPDHWDIAGYKNGKLVMMTIDHIFPKSKGGPDHISNYQPMCGPCNSKKSDKIVS